MQASADAQADAAQLMRYQYELEINHVEPPIMHLSSQKNFRDYFAYFFVYAIATTLLIWLLVPSPGRVLGIAPLVGLVSMTSVIFRDAQHRQMPKDLAIAPRQFASDAKIILNSGVEHLQRAEQLALFLSQSVDRLALTVESARSVVRGDDAPREGAYLGKGFE